ncbi:Anaphase-promoting complex subunit 8 [Elasticomyces elasticus]|uniref:Anaphase-promoting complex subunit 8 n=1 Tax=Exophiala sideris TaxID=1016849 RepID=A0ABR0JNJ7_9EURO|nr:Anaphase-promoting complex subunit 8 [Elasticomyces elasticus]KAK5038069.1 Anaphase-promoting complex subunit 8 [Exophiala sideris]KAK5044051.1 Anaphase-promoting complex subunit 8 [Exophiala sideris]KAK5067551.1 Anaphase-promoting complex subunit 8 [Exophiala sideris]KAK5184210.1 Anaphase-promoting complex subunit 8 [Eurotiomycetes sp. CCFEE 6388]
MVLQSHNESFGLVGEIDPEVVSELRDRLTEASIKCSERCLYQSAKWAAELLNSLPENNDLDDDSDSRMYDTNNVQPSYRIFSTSYDDPEEAALEAKEAPKYLLAKAFFDTKEFDRCAAVFLPPAIPAGGLAIFDKPKGRTSTSTPSRHKGKTRQADSAGVNPFPRLSQKSLFLSLYARFLGGEKRKDEETEMVLGPADGGQTTNRELPALARGLEAYFRARDATDPQQKRSQGWLEYLYGIVLSKSRQEDLAQQWLLRSVRINPYHWGAWEELASLLSSVDDLSAQISPSVLPQNIMSIMYQACASVDLFSTTDHSATLSYLRTLLSYFPTSTFLLTQLATLHYHAKEYETAASIFQDLLIAHPHRLDGLDHYSNILYVMTDRPKLAFLAHLATSVDKFRPETCCVVGNYYSLCSQHEKAVMYFRRALTLDRNFLSAWTLMGHEYIELKNTHAAIESYRRAVDVNRKDYRAWYGLGQAYEVLDMGFYALFYYQRAAGLRPYDPKMWQAVASCYAKMDRLEQAIKAQKRALVAGTYFDDTRDNSPQSSFANRSKTSQTQQERKTPRKLLDPETLYQIALLYERMGAPGEADAARYMELCVTQETGGSHKSVVQAEKALKKRQRKEARASAVAEERRARISAMRAEAGTGQDVDVSLEDDAVEGQGDDDTEILSSSSPLEESMDNVEDQDPGDNDGFGTGTTATTSKARLWLARWSVKMGDLDRAERLAEELCMDGYEVEEAKGLVREVRGRREAMLDSDV